LRQDCAWYALTGSATRACSASNRSAAGFSYAALGDKGRAIAAFEAFLKKDAQHPLARDAERALAALR
jgi:hypothetical protein